MFKLLLILMISTSVMAGEKCSTSNSEEVATEKKLLSTDVPNHLKGAMITITLADGRQSTVHAERFKVVPRKQQWIVTKTLSSSTTMCSNDPEKNRISLLAGHGARAGLNRSVDDDGATVKSRVGVVGGAQYQRLITDKLSIGVQAQTNKTGSLMLGLDF